MPVHRADRGRSRRALAQRRRPARCTGIPGKGLSEPGFSFALGVSKGALPRLIQPKNRPSTSPGRTGHEDPLDWKSP